MRETSFGISVALVAVLAAFAWCYSPAATSVSFASAVDDREAAQLVGGSVCSGVSLELLGNCNACTNNCQTPIQCPVNQVIDMPNGPGSTLFNQTGNCGGCANNLPVVAGEDACDS